jgi:hypothetical protein
MIDKIISDASRAIQNIQEQAQQTEVAQPYVPPQPQPTENHIAQERKFAQSVRSESMMSSALLAQRLGAALDKQTPPVESQPNVGSELPVSIGGPGPAANTNEVLGLNMSGPQVRDFQVQLNYWRTRNNLPLIPDNGVYTQETADAVSQFQEACGLTKDGLAGPNTKTRLQLENDYKFQRMNPDIQKEIRSMLNDYQKNPAARDNLLKLVGDQEFSTYLSPQMQANSLGLFKQNPADPNHLANTIDTSRDMSALEDDPTFKNLSVASKFEVTEALYEHAIFPDGRDAIARLATSSRFEQLTEAAQLMLFKAISQNPGELIAPELLHILHSDSFEKMTPPLRDLLLEVACENASSPESLKRLSEDVNNPAFLDYNDTEQWDMVSSFHMPPDPYNTNVP